MHLAPDQCAFTIANCGGDEAGLIRYLTFYYCTLGTAQPVAFAVLAVWLGLLFTTIGVAASEFFSINLSTIASVLGLSESLAGVTFLAFGNGSPDVFSTFAAMGSNSGSMAVGELIGAASFITAVVAGSMALVREFKVNKRTFVRDVCFFILAVSFAMVILSDGHLHFWECIAMICFYLFYVVTVVGWHWYSDRQRRRRLKDAASRGPFHGGSGRGTEELEPYRDEPEDGVEDALPLGRRRNTVAVGADIGALERGIQIQVDGVDAAPFKSPEAEEDKGRLMTAEMKSSMRVNRPRWARSNTTIHPIRPSLVGALEFRSILSSLNRERSMHVRSFSDRVTMDNPKQLCPQLEPARAPVGVAPKQPILELPEPNAPAQDSRDDALPLHLESECTSPLSDIQVASTRGPVLVSRNGRLAPPADPLHAALPSSSVAGSSSSQGTVRRLQLQIPVLSRQSSGASSPATSPFPVLFDSPLPLSPAGLPDTPSAYRFSAVPERRPSMSMLEESVKPPKMIRWWPYRLLPPPHVLLGTLFPTLQGWTEKSTWDKAVSLISVPSIFLLVSTLPVVETESDLDGSEENDAHCLADSIPGDVGKTTPPAPTEALALVEPDIVWHEYRRRARTNTVSRSPMPRSPPLGGIDAPCAAQRQVLGDTTRAQPLVLPQPAKPGSSEDPDAGSNMADPAGWNRWLVLFQLFTGPLFVVFIVWANLAEGLEQPYKDLLRWMLCSLVFSLVLLVLLLLTTSPDKKPKYHFLLCFLGFVISVAWISTIAGEVVGVLKAFGVILGISEAILGLTIFAVGNSLGDLVADVTVARLGYPVMAL